MIDNFWTGWGGTIPHQLSLPYEKASIYLKSTGLASKLLPAAILDRTQGAVGVEYL
jgi:hypothetical protein